MIVHGIKLDFELDIKSLFVQKPFYKNKNWIVMQKIITTLTDQIGEMLI